ncbi:hypothetical protein A2434_00210 [Candidatus Woesebacteria bacterium RIFOXYC1_FULL_41_14]|nr:MAG: hypothetical protein A2434_00210 [Candidatus Woesebacteria bacterium RIFOXYC1_FULL_41_14]
MPDFRELLIPKEKYANAEFGSATLKKEGSTQNEDTYFCIKNAAGVFDGVGGRSQGEMASKVARDYLKSFFSSTFASGDFPLYEVKNFVDQKIHGANYLVYTAAQDADCDAATTATLAFVRKNEKGTPYVLFANVGDSRGYVLREGVFFQITEDDNEVKSIYKDKKRAGQIQDRLNRAKSFEDLDDDEIDLFMNRNKISQALGKPQIEVNFSTAVLNKGDIVVLCTDGVSDNLTTEEMEAAVRGKKNPQEIAECLVGAAGRRSGQGKKVSIRSKNDDITAVAISAF